MRTETSLKRECVFECVRGENADRTVELSFSSEQPVDRGSYLEILSHAPGDVDLSRLNNSHPVLINHDVDRVVGVILKAWVADGKGRALVKFSRSPLGDEIWRDVQDGIRRLVSVGYQHTREIESSKDSNGVETVKFAWAPYEISIVAVPADQSVGIGRHSQERIIYMNSETTQDYKQTAREILAIAELRKTHIPNAEKLAHDAIGRGASVDEFRKIMLDNLPKPALISTVADDFAREAGKHNYSLARAILTYAETGRVDGLEGEVSQEIARRTGERPRGFYADPNLLTRVMIAGTNSLGGYAVPTFVDSDWVAALRAKSVFMNAGLKVMPGLTGNVAIPRIATGSSASWLAETAVCSASAIEVEQVLLQPKTCAVGIEYSKLLLAQAPGVDGIVRDDLAGAIGEAIDLAVAHGTGSTQPTGLQTATGVNSVALGTNGGAPSWDMLLDLEEACSTANAPERRAGYVTNPKVRAALKATAKLSGGDVPVWGESRAADGSELVNNYKALASSIIASNLTKGTATTICSACFYASDWAQAVLGLWGQLDFVVDPYTLAGNRVVKVWCHSFLDFQLRQPAAFARCLDAITG